jgi:glycosyltransferase involved in cell wall biosynthesis
VQVHVAWFSPMPPVRSGIAAYSADLVPALAREHAIDLFVDEAVVRTARPEQALRSAHEFVWRHRQRPYDLIVYQLGNSSHHDYLWPYLFRFPGLTVLHDAHLHHGRAANLLRERRAADYRREFAATEPDVDPDAAELVVAGFDSHLLYQWPFTRLVVSGSRATAVHSRLMRDALATAHPAALVEHVRLGHGTAVEPRDVTALSAATRRKYGIPADALVFGCVGGITPEKRIPQIFDAFEALLPYQPSAWLLLAGAPADHYDPGADIRRRRLQTRAIVTGYLDKDDDLTACIAASDVALNLRWPTAREVSGPWIRCLAAGKPTVVTDLAHMADVPALDPRTWMPTSARPAVAVSIDILDEAHSLRLALRRLAADAALRRALGDAARQYWREEHTIGGMVDDYRRIMARAAARPAPETTLPAHLRSDASETLDTILGAFDVPLPWSKI